MIRSMTGYAEVQLVDGRVLQIRSVNQRGLELRVTGLRRPDQLHRIEKRIRQVIRRGRLQLSLLDHLPDKVFSIGVDEEKLQRLSVLVRRWVEAGVLPSMPDSAWLLDAAKQVSTESEADLDESALDRLLQRFVLDREREGQALAVALTDILEEMGLFVRTLGDIRAQELEQIRASSWRRLQEELDRRGGNEADIPAAVAAWLVRGDIREELDRLVAHVARAGELIEEDEPASGQELETLGQEILREANTLCSKVQSPAGKEAGIQLRLRAEQYREQIANVE